MKEQGITRNVIQIISRHSNWKAAEIKKTLIAEVYSDRKNWAEFVLLPLIGIGSAFCLAGIIFFLAYNWHLMHKFLKLGLVQGLVIAIIVTLLTVNLKPLVKDVLLMSAAILVGAMFSVFGQIYQTGADAYDFFLGWTVFIAVWALIANFAPLWLLLIALANITFVFFVSQAGPNWPTSNTYLILFVVDALVLHAMQVLFKKNKVNQFPLWFSRSLALVVAFYITLGITICIFERAQNAWPLFLVLATLNYTFEVYHSFTTKSLFSLCVIPLSLIVIICAAIGEIADGNIELVLFLLSIFVISSVTLMIRWLMNLNRRWNGTR